MVLGLRCRAVVPMRGFCGLQSHNHRSKVHIFATKQALKLANSFMVTVSAAGARPSDDAKGPFWV